MKRLELTLTEVIGEQVFKCTRSVSLPNLSNLYGLKSIASYELEELHGQLEVAKDRHTQAVAAATAAKPQGVSAPERVFWCNVHQRRAQTGYHCSNELGGIMLPCRVVELTGLVELHELERKVESQEVKQ
jgi:hypothetical protein